MHNLAFAQFIKSVILVATMGGMEPADAEVAASVQAEALEQAFSEDVPVQEAAQVLESPEALVEAGMLKAELS